MGVSTEIDGKLQGAVNQRAYLRQGRVRGFTSADGFLYPVSSEFNKTLGPNKAI